MSALTVLLVEDDATLQRSIERALEHAGARVFAVRTADEANHVLRTEDVHAVLADVGLGDDEPSGIRVLTIARVMRPRAMRVLMSGSRTDAVVATIADGLAEHFLHKPFGLAVLTDIVRDALGRRDNP